MPVTAYPYETQDTTETQYARILRETQDDGVAGEVGSGALACTAPGGGMTLSVADGLVWARGVVLEVTGGNVTVDVDAAGGSARTDLLVARLDSVNNIGSLVVKPGPGGATLPALTLTDNVWEVPLWTVAVGAGVTQVVQANLTDVRPFTGGRVGAWTTASRPGRNGTPEPRRGRTGFNVTTGLLETYDGDTWVPVGESIRLVDLVLPGYDTLRGKTLHDGDNPPAASLGAVGDWYAEW